MFNVELVVTENPNLVKEVELPRLPVVGDTLNLHQEEDRFWGMFRVTEVFFIIEKGTCFRVVAHLVAVSDKTEERTRLSDGS